MSSALSPPTGRPRLLSSTLSSRTFMSSNAWWGRTFQVLNLFRSSKTDVDESGGTRARRGRKLGDIPQTGKDNKANLM